MQNEIKFRDFPILSWLFAAASIGYGVFLFVTMPSTALIMASVCVGIGVLLLLMNYALTITVNKQTRTLTLDYRSLVHHSVKEIPLDEISTIRNDSRSSRSHSSRSGSRTTTYCIIAERKNAEPVPFRSFYSSGFWRKQKIVDGLRKFMDLPDEIDESPIGFLRAAPTIGAEIARKQQEALTGPNAEEHITNDVHWRLQSAGMGAAPITRWFSPDFKTQNGFLFLAQKVAGQSSTGLLATLGSMLFKQSLSMYGFGADDTPNLAQADVIASIPPQLDKHFMAFGNNKSEATQILNAWAQRPLADWGERHPLKQFQSGTATQLVVLFSPNGVYLGTMGALGPAQVEELTAIGVELVKAQ